MATVTKEQDCLATVPVPEKKKEETEGCISVTSPIVGIFYAAPAENADPYVAAGEKVKKGQTLCIVEAMKLMNEITAEEDGIITEEKRADALHCGSDEADERDNG